MKDEFKNCIDTKNNVNLNNQMKIDTMNCCLKSAIKSADEKYSRVISSNKDKKIKIWYGGQMI